MKMTGSETTLGLAAFAGVGYILWGIAKGLLTVFIRAITPNARQAK